MKIGVVGSNMYDLVTYITRMPAPGETIEAPSFEMGFGGKGANQAVAAARLGGDVLMMTRLGDDVFGDATLKNLRDNGIDTRLCEKVPGTPSGVAPIFVEPSGENSILIIKGANATLTPDQVDAAGEVLAECGLILMQMEIPVETVYRTIELAARHGITTILNPAPAAADLDAARLKDLGFLVPNESELALLSGMPTGTEAETLAAARALIGKGVRNVIVTLGGRGARIVTADDVITIPPVAVDPVDTTGAGDAFIGAFARYYAETPDAAAAAGQAARYAALSITRRGTQKSYADAEGFAAFCARLEG